MKTIRVCVFRDDADEDSTEFIVIPIQIPESVEIHEYANLLHLRGEEYHGQMWGWPVHYEPELVEESAIFAVPDGQNSWKHEVRKHWSPASFTIGESGVWFYSLLWENGREKEPIEFLDVTPAEEAVPDIL